MGTDVTLTELGTLVRRPRLVGAGAAVELILRGREHGADLVVEAGDVGGAAEGLARVEPARVVVGCDRAVGVVAARHEAVALRRRCPSREEEEEEEEEEDVPHGAGREGAAGSWRVSMRVRRLEGTTAGGGAG